ncbi:hypothetical protein SAMN05660649_00185 [Desulfotomaculum arcticum]|uniref:Uncharacterized protein n=1 Tax=Desulfotruncus arcticus DSM 17038 TaxID=1121424 RepID=A0A1I2MV99_9FIRM|nr:hypothetical protein SAMN05660649_00185 [Desulfotomaculum arcticum] [Desulfotruncus arcticus DSM 17038]
MLSNNYDFISNTWLLDVANLPNPFPKPFSKQGILRKDNRHYIYLNPPYATIHSDPVKVDLVKLDSFFSEGAPDADGVNHLFENYQHFEKFRKDINRNSLGAIVLP